MLDWLERNHRCGGGPGNHSEPVSTGTLTNSSHA
jgi:hypothetical protein